MWKCWLWKLDKKIYKKKSNNVIYVKTTKAPIKLALLCFSSAYGGRSTCFSATNRCGVVPESSLSPANCTITDGSADMAPLRGAADTVAG